MKIYEKLMNIHENHVKSKITRAPRARRRFVRQRDIPHQGPALPPHLASRGPSHQFLPSFVFRRTPVRIRSRRRATMAPSRTCTHPGPGAHLRIMAPSRTCTHGRVLPRTRHGRTFSARGHRPSVRRDAVKNGGARWYTSGGREGCWGRVRASPSKTYWPVHFPGFAH